MIAHSPALQGSGERTVLDGRAMSMMPIEEEDAADRDACAARRGQGQHGPLGAMALMTKSTDDQPDPEDEQARIGRDRRQTASPSQKPTAPKRATTATYQEEVRADCQDDAGDRRRRPSS
jgi:hypothetical protein